MVFTVENLPELEAHLTNNATLTEGGIPGPADAVIYLALGKLPDVQATPNLHYWYQFINSFIPPVIAKWAAAAQPAEKPKVEAPKQDDDFDPFAEDAAPVEKPKPKVEAKPKKPKAIAKSIVVFDVKVYDSEADLNALAAKVLALQIDGLTWSKEFKTLDVAYGIKKLQIGCVIEDDKVLTDDIFDQILAWEDEVQSVDTVSMQKL